MATFNFGAKPFHQLDTLSSTELLYPHWWGLLWVDKTSSWGNDLASKFSVVI